MLFCCHVEKLTALTHLDLLGRLEGEAHIPWLRQVSAKNKIWNLLCDTTVRGQTRMSVPTTIMTILHF